MGGVTDDVLLARAFLSRVAEPASLPIWRAVRRDGPVAAAAELRAGRIGDRTSEAMRLRARHAVPEQDLEVAERHGIRLVVPESDDWPHYAMSALEAAALRCVAQYRRAATPDATKTVHENAARADPIPPLALWVRGATELSPLAIRSVAIVGSRAATEYGHGVATDLAARLAERGFVIVSGGALGIDSAAHRGALTVGGQTVLVSAGGLDRSYPPGNEQLFDRVAGCGLLISESPPGAAPQRRRFLTRNRLIATFATGTIVVEAAARSGALNTAGHCRTLGKPLMAVPGPITSPMSVGCHQLLASEHHPAALIGRVDDVIALIGSSSELPPTESPPADDLADRLSAMAPIERQVYDGFPARGWTDPDAIAIAAGLAPLSVMRALPSLELAGLIEASAHGYRIVRSRRSKRQEAGSRKEKSNIGAITESDADMTVSSRNL